MNRAELLVIFRRIVALLFVAAAFAYTGITLLYVMPDNCPLRKENKVFLDAIDPFFFQRWNFFAPPPQSNYRVYFIYSSSIDTKAYKCLEITQPIERDKAAKSFFNEDARELDYIIHGVCDQTSRMVVQMQHYTEGLKNPVDRLTIDSEINSPNINSIKSYAGIVAKTNGLVPKYDICSVEIAEVALPDFKNRSLILAPFNGPSVLICRISPFYIEQSNAHEQRVN